jgi:gamma-glutamyl:cysteine ligase YbdK (ATP-grasp superfamily)
VRAFALLLLGLIGSSVHAQTSPARGSAATLDLSGEDIPLGDYLGLLEQIAPAARQGAQAYLDAVQRRCGRTLTAAELRRAIAEQDGDPLLMQMIRASYLQDTAALSRLSGQVPCRQAARR